jgi:hypothetical protein
MERNYEGKESRMDWTLVEHRASASWGETKAAVDTLDLRTGLALQTAPWHGASIGALPAITPTASIETYVRGTDLVTTHPATNARPTRIQLYWRRWHGLPASVAAAVELIASVQTHLLDSDPSLVIESRVPQANKALQTEGVTEIQAGSSQLLILTHPHDATEVELQTSDASAAVQHILFRRRLEKGVILRGRLLFVWSDQPVAADELKECADRFKFSEPMLTA